jgi:hypothetical protein
MHAMPRKTHRCTVEEPSGLMLDSEADGQKFRHVLEQALSKLKK